MSGPGAQLDIFDVLSMDSDARQVLNCIRERVGRKRAIPVASISEQTNIPSRTVRDIVRDLLGRHPLVRSFRAGRGNEGGDGATIVSL